MGMHAARGFSASGYLLQSTSYMRCSAGRLGWGFTGCRFASLLGCRISAMASSVEHPLNPTVARLLLIKPSSLGDIVHALPAFVALRARFPQAELSWLVKAQWSGILARVQGLDRIWRVGPSLTDWLATIRQLREHQFDLVVDLQGLFRSGAAAWLTGCGTRVGFATAREGSPLCYTHRVPVPTPEMHAVDRYLLVAQAVGCTVDAAVSTACPIVPSAQDRDTARTLLQRAGVRDEQPWVAMSVSARWTTKRWRLESFIAVAQQLRRDGVPVVLIGAASDRADTQAVAEQAGAVDLSGQTGLELLPSVLQSAACFVTNDSGPMHVAAAMGTPVVALFGPTSEVRTGPYGARHRVLTAPVPCRPCFSRTCRHGVPLECLTSISSESVVLAVREIMNRDRTVRVV